MIHEHKKGFHSLIGLERTTKNQQPKQKVLNENFNFFLAKEAGASSSALEAHRSPTVSLLR